MIRFLQKDNRIVKGLFIVIIAAAVVTMVVTLVPGIFQGALMGNDTYATVYPHWYSRLTFSGERVSTQRVNAMAQQQLQRQHLPDFILPFLLDRVGQQIIMQQILLIEAKKLGITVSDEDLRAYMHTGTFGQVLFPNGQFIGEDKYESLIQSQFGISVADFETEVKHDIAINRLRTLVTAGVTVSDAEVRDAYRKANIKIKFDYAVLSPDDLKKEINPSDSDLQAFFTKNAPRYANAVPEQRTIRYFAFTTEQIPNGVPQVSQTDIQAYYSAHQNDFKVDEQAKARHILIAVQGTDPAADAKAKAKADGILKQLQNGGDFAALAKANSDDPGSKDSGGELGFAKRGTMVPEFEQAIFTQPIGQYSIVKTKFGYHIIQVEARQTAHTQPLNEVLPSIQAQLVRQKLATAETNYAQQLTTEATKNGLDKTAAAHNLTVVTTPSIAASGVIGALPDGTQLIGKAFQAKLNGTPDSASTGEGYAIFQVTGIIAAHAPTFAEYKDHIASDYAAERLPQLLQEKTKQLADKAKLYNDLNKAAKELGATVKTSDLVGATAQVPDFGQISAVAPQLFDLPVGGISGPINAQRTGVVAKIDDKQEPTADEITKNLDQTRDQLLNQRREEAFTVFITTLQDDYKKHRLIALNQPKQATTPIGAK